jgi:four helix bundle protein
MKREEKAVPRYQTSEDLEAYQVARQFRKAMYHVAKRLPEERKFGLVPQMRRSAVSLPNNIAEGHGRFNFLDQIKFMTRGSLEELIDDLNVCGGESYLDGDQVKRLKHEAWRVHQLINGSVRFLRSHLETRSDRIKESSDDVDLTEDEMEVLFADRFSTSPFHRFNA